MGAFIWLFRTSAYVDAFANAPTSFEISKARVSPIPCCCRCPARGCLLFCCQHDPALEEVDDPGPSLLGQKRQLQKVRQNRRSLFNTEYCLCLREPMSIFRVVCRFRGEMSTGAQNVSDSYFVFAEGRPSCTCLLNPSLPTAPPPLPKSDTPVTGWATSPTPLAPRGSTITSAPPAATPPAARRRRRAGRAPPAATAAATATAASATAAPMR